MINLEKIKLYRINIIIDSGITRNFILLDIVLIYKLDIRIKVILYKLLIINRNLINTNNRIINIKIKKLILEISKEYLKYIRFDIIFIN